MDPGIFAMGTTTDDPKGVNMSNSGRLLRWVAVRGNGWADWAIYVLFADNDWDYIRTNGDKIYNKDNVEKLIDCDDAALDRYRD